MALSGCCKLPEDSLTNKIPTHIGLIPDGNRRYARSRGLTLFEAYEQGVSKVREFLRWCRDYNIKYVSIYALSNENLMGRSKEELEIIFSLMKKYLREMRDDPEIHENEVRIQFAGERQVLPEDLLNLMNDIEKRTEGYSKYHVILLVNYGGRQEILKAIKELLKNGYNPDDVTIDDIREHLYLPKVPDPDLVIRTSGEMRISNFLLWQIAYSELYFSKKLWPEFTRQDFDEAIREYTNRERRYGR